MEDESTFTMGRESLWEFIEENHEAFIAAEKGEKWSKDEIIAQANFRSIFREYEEETRALRKSIPPNWEPQLIVFNILLYRMFKQKKLCNKVEDSFRQKEQIFQDLDGILNACQGNTLEGMFNWFLTTYTSCYQIDLCSVYNIVCDFRWYTNLLWKATDKTSWASIGLDCRYGLHRLKMQPTRESLRHLYELARQNCPSISDHFANNKSDGVWPPFELCDMERSVAEFEKYMRIYDEYN